MAESADKYTAPEKPIDVVVHHEQHLAKSFNWLSILAATVSLMATWEAFCATMATGLVSGGPVALVWGYILAVIGTLSTCLSLAEMSSMFPTAGGQYHFVAFLTSSKSGRILSYAAGWVTTFGWQTFTASAPFLAGTMIQGLLVLNYPDYDFKRWHGTMLYWAVLLVAMVANIWGSRILPLIENGTAVLHITLFFVLLMTIPIISPNKKAASFVFTDFENNSGWSSNGVAWSLGMLSASYVLTGCDGAVHLSEEIPNPSVGVPRAMVGTVAINSVLGFAFLLTILFCMPDIATALNTNTGYPIIQIFYTMTGQNARAASAMTCALIVMAVGATVPLLLASSRVLWAFARDSGLPFSNSISRVSPGRGIPSIAIYVSTILLAVLGLLNIASTTAFNAIISLAVVGLYLSYLLPVIIMLIHRIRVTSITLPSAPIRLSRALGITVNIISILYTTFTCIFLIFPPYQPVTAINMNYASVVLGAVLIFAIIDWFCRGNKRYQVPTLEIIGRSMTNSSSATA